MPKVIKDYKGTLWLHQYDKFYSAGFGLRHFDVITKRGYEVLSERMRS
jgi:hypothetical protein